MTRETSIEAYHRIKDDGLLSLRRMQVYEVLYHHGPMTGNEVLQKLKDVFKMRPGNAPSIVSRLGELRNLGVVKEVGKTICSVSGMTVINWDVTANLPIKLEKPHREKCKTCDGKGYIETQQGKFL